MVIQKSKIIPCRYHPCQDNIVFGSIGGRWKAFSAEPVSYGCYSLTWNPNWDRYFAKELRGRDLSDARKFGRHLYALHSMDCYGTSGRNQMQNIGVNVTKREKPKCPTCRHSYHGTMNECDTMSKKTKQKCKCNYSKLATGTLYEKKPVETPQVIEQTVLPVETPEPVQEPLMETVNGVTRFKGFLRGFLSMFGAR